MGYGTWTRLKVLETSFELRGLDFALVPYLLAPYKYHVCLETSIDAGVVVSEILKVIYFVGEAGTASPMGTFPRRGTQIVESGTVDDSLASHWARMYLLWAQHPGMSPDLESRAVVVVILNI